jgi:acetyl esterase/lipase
MQRAWMRTLMLLPVAVLCAGAAAYFLGGPDSFYDASLADLRGAPGTIIRTQAMPASPGTKAWRVLYRSTGLNGEPIATSGVVIAPETAGPNRPIVAWAHPTTGIARRCAPSLGSDFARTVPGLDEMARRGFVVAATDYAGLGAAGAHPYLVGVSAARSILDSVRAARALTQASPQFAVWGHSQGGHAVLWAGKLAADYAPDIKLTGIAAAAPPTELATLFQDDLTTPAGQTFTALTLLAWSRVYGLDVDTVIEPRAVRYVKWIGDECMNNVFDLFMDKLAMHGLGKQFLKADPLQAKPWQDLITANTPDGLPTNVPLLIAQGRNDGLILPKVTRSYLAGFCSTGGVAELLERDSGHLEIASVAAKAAVDWMADRFAGKPAPNGCKVLASK